MTDKEIGEKILERMREINSNQRELAKKAGVTEVALARYISGDRHIKKVPLLNIAMALKTTAEELTGEKIEGEI